MIGPTGLDKIYDVPLQRDAPRAHAKLTEVERAVWNAEGNLADGHARIAAPLSIYRMRGRLGGLISRAISSDQRELEDEFCSAFFRFFGRSKHRMGQRPLLCPSASIAIETVGNFLRLQGHRVLLLEPTFDNIADIMKRHVSTILAVPEQAILQSLKGIRSRSDLCALFLVMPNNPTGWVPTCEEFRAVAEECARKRILLIVDMSFRTYSPSLDHWSPLDILRGCEVSHIVIGDTGKTLSTLELKVAPLIVSGDILAAIRDIYDDLLVGVSPLTLCLATDLLTQGKEPLQRLRQIVRSNQRMLRVVLARHALAVESTEEISVAWIRTPRHLHLATFLHRLERQGVSVLPGQQFFWNSPHRGNNHFRVALLRPHRVFRNAIGVVDDLLTNMRGKHT